MFHRALASGAQSRVILSVGIVLALTAAAPAAPGNLFGINGLTITGAGTWTGVTMFAGWLLREWRETRKLSSADRLARREGYAKQVENLQAENRRLRGDLAEAEQRHDEYRHACQQETDGLRAAIRALEDMVTGFKRTMDAQAQAIGRAMLGQFDAPTTAEKIRNDDGKAQG